MKARFRPLRTLVGSALLLCLLLAFGAVRAQWPCAEGGIVPADTAFAVQLDRAFRCATSGCCLQEAEQFLIDNDTTARGPLDKARMLLMQVKVGSLPVNDKIRRTERAEELLRTAEGDADRIRNTRIWINVLLADAYSETPDSEKFGHYCSEVQRMFDEGVTDTAALVLGSGKLVAYHAIAGNIVRAEEAAHRAYRLGRNAPLEKTLNAAYLNLAFLKYNMGQPDSAAWYARQSLEVTKGLGFHYLKTRAAQILGFVHHDQGNYAAYLSMTDTALSAILRTGQALFIANAYQQKANALNKNRLYREALEAAETGLRYSPSQFQVRRELYRVMVEAADSLGDHRTALSLQRLLTDTKDSIHAQNLEQTLVRLNAQYESERKDARITELEAERLREANRSQQLLLLGISLLLLLTLLAGMAVTVHRARRQQAERLLFDRQHGIDHQMLEAVEEERRRISAILHDTVAGSLSGLAHLTDYIAGLSGDPAKQQEQLRLMQQRLNGLYGQVRDLSHELMPFQREEGVSFCEQLSALIDTHFHHVPFLVETELPHREALEALSESQQMLVVRFVQEGLANAARHAQAARVRVSSSEAGGHLTLTIADDGIGMQDERRGVGLAHLSHLAGNNGAVLRVTSPQDGGTRLELSFNL